MKVLDLIGQPYDSRLFIEQTSQYIKSKSVLEKISYIDIGSEFNEKSEDYYDLVKSLFEQANNDGINISFTHF